MNVDGRKSMNGKSMKSESLKETEKLKREKSEFVKNVGKRKSTDTEYEYTDEAWDYMNDFENISLDDLGKFQC